MGGQDKQGFPMKQGVLVPGRVQLLMKPGDSCFRGFGRRNGERRRKSVRGCIVSPDLSVLNLMIVKQGELQNAHLRITACIELQCCGTVAATHRRDTVEDTCAVSTLRQLPAAVQPAMQCSNSSNFR